MRFAETGAGTIAWAPPYYRLRAGAQDVALAVDRPARTPLVIRFYRAQ